MGVDNSGTTVAVLAIDGGNSKTDVALVALDGTVLARVRGPGANAQKLGLPEAMRIICSLVRQAALDAGLTPGERLAKHTAAYLAGVDVPREEVALAGAVRDQRWSDSITVDNDTFAVFRAGTTKHWGVGVVVGAGTNAVGKAPDGRTARFVAIGALSGDFGGGHDLSQWVMWHAARDEDGRGAPTALRQAVIDHFGMASVHDVVVAFHLGQLRRADQLALTPLLFQVAACGDAIAADLVDRQAREVALLAKSVMRRLDLMSTPTDVVLGGGVLTPRDPLLMRRVEHWMAREVPTALTRVNDVPAIAGAALLGLDHLGLSGPGATGGRGGTGATGADAEQRLRNAFGADPMTQL